MTTRFNRPARKSAGCLATCIAAGSQWQELLYGVAGEALTVEYDEVRSFKDSLSLSGARSSACLWSQFCRGCPGLSALTGRTVACPCCGPGFSMQGQYFKLQCLLAPLPAPGGMLRRAVSGDACGMVLINGGDQMFEKFYKIYDEETFEAVVLIQKTLGMGHSVITAT